MSANASPRAPVSASPAGSGVMYDNAPAAIAAAEAALASAAAAADASGTRRRRAGGAGAAGAAGAGGAAVAAADAADRNSGGEKGGGGGGAVVEAMRRIATAASAAQSVYARVCPTARQPYYYERFAVDAAVDGTSSGNPSSSTSPASPTSPTPPAYSYSTPSWSPPARYIQLVRSLRRGVEAIRDYTKHHTNKQRERDEVRDEVRETTHVVLGLLKQRTDDAAVLYPLLSLCSGLADDDHSFEAVPLLASRAALLANVILVQVRRGGRRRGGRGGREGVEDKRSERSGDTMLTLSWVCCRVCCRGCAAACAVA